MSDQLNDGFSVRANLINAMDELLNAVHVVGFSAVAMPDKNGID